MNAALDRARDIGCRYLHAAVLRVTRGTSEAIEDNVTALGSAALFASRTVDDAVRQYLSESGGATDSRAPAVRAQNRVIRLRAAADIIADIKWPPPVTTYPRAKEILERHTDAVCDRLSGREVPLPPISDELVPALRAESIDDELAVAAALPLVTIAANLGELELVYPAPEPEPEPELI